MTALTISRARRSDSGTYSLCLENANGKATVDIKVKVLGMYDTYINTHTHTHTYLYNVHLQIICLGDHLFKNS